LKGIDIMGKKDYRVGEGIEVVYQAQNAATEVVVNMEVYDETHTIVAGGPIVLVELGTSGRYYGTFTPDEAGEWSVQIEQAGGVGKATKSFSVGGHNIHEIGAKVVTIEDNVGSLGTNMGTVEGKVDSLPGKHDTTHTKVDNVKTKVDSMDVKIDNLGSPSMIG